MSVAHARNILHHKGNNFYKNHIKRIILESYRKCTKGLFQKYYKHATLYLSQIMSILSIPVDDVRNEEQIGILDITRFNCIYHRIIYYTTLL